MSTPPVADRRTATRRATARLALFASILALQFFVFEAALRVWGGSEAAPSFQGLFEGDPQIGFRLKPNARIHFATSEFATDIAINAAGVRDDEEIGPKAPGERRIVLLGDSIVLAVQVPFPQTFGELLEARLNATADGSVYRVINAGVQGYGPVEEALFFERIAEKINPDLVVVMLYVGNDAEEAYRSAARLNGATRQGIVSSARQSARSALRRTVRRSMVLQVLRLRVVTALERMGFGLQTPEPPLQSYAADPADRIAAGLAITRRAVERIAAAASRIDARTAVALLPARFQIDDDDYERLREAVLLAGGELIRDAATLRFDEVLAEVPLPRIDLLPALRAALPGPDVFYQHTAHLTPHGHEVVADALAEFILSEALLGPPGH